MEKQQIQKELKGGEEQQMEKVTCIHCGYTWTSNSEKIFVSCPSCLKKTPVKEIKPSILIENGK